MGNCFCPPTLYPTALVKGSKRAMAERSFLAGPVLRSICIASAFTSSVPTKETGLVGTSAVAPHLGTACPGVNPPPKGQGYLTPDDDFYKKPSLQSPDP